MTEQQEKDVLEKCIDLATKLTGKRPVGYRAPLYQIRESTIKLLVEHGFSYGASVGTTHIHFLSPSAQLMPFQNRHLALRPRLPTISRSPRHPNQSSRFLQTRCNLDAPHSHPNRHRHRHLPRRDRMQLVHGRHDTALLLPSRAKLARLR